MKFIPVAALALIALLAGEACAQAPAIQDVAAVPQSDDNYSAARLYNLANSYARAGKTGLAVLNYERAALLAPNDADIQTNLQSVRAAAHVPPEPTGRLTRIAHWTNPTGVAMIGLLGFLILGSSLLAGTFLQTRWGLWAALSCLGVAAIGFTVGNAIYWRAKLHEAVVIASNTQIRATPVPMGDPLQQLAEAETVVITADHEDFVLVRTAAGRDGWVARADLADVVPIKPSNRTP